MQKKSKKISEKPTNQQARNRAQKADLKRRKQIRFRRLSVLFVFCVVTFVALAVTVLFPIKEIEVNGNTRYEESELLAMAGIEKNNNMFRTNMGGAQKKLKDTYPYIEEVNIKRSLSGKITVDITEATETGAVEVNKKFVIISGQNRILKIGQAKKPQEVYLLKGVTIREPVAGEYLQITDEATNHAIIELFELLSKYPLGNVSLIDVTNRSKLIVEIDNKKRVIFGDNSELEYKAKMVKKIIDEKLNPNESVIVDATIPSRVVVSPKKD